MMTTKNNIYIFLMPHVLSPVFQGTNASALEKDIGPEQFPINEHYFGLVNVSITKSSHTLTKGIAKKNTGVIFQNKPLWYSGESCPLLDS